MKQSTKFIIIYLGTWLAIAFLSGMLFYGFGLHKTVTWFYLVFTATMTSTSLIYVLWRGFVDRPKIAFHLFDMSTYRPQPYWIAFVLFMLIIATSLFSHFFTDMWLLPISFSLLLAWLLWDSYGQVIIIWMLFVFPLGNVFAAAKALQLLTASGIVPADRELASFWLCALFSSLAFIAHPLADWLLPLIRRRYVKKRPQKAE